MSVRISGKTYTMASNGDVLSETATTSSVSVNNFSVNGDRNLSVWQGFNFPSVFYFPIGTYKLLRNYRYNNIMLDALDEVVAKQQMAQNVDTIEIIGACSPVGGEELNVKLALSRCMALRSYLRWKHLRFAESVPIKFNIIGIDRLGYDILKQQNPPLAEKQIWDMLQYAAIMLKMKDGTYIIPGSDKPKPVNFKLSLSAGSSEKTDASRTVRDTVYLKCDTVYMRDTIVLIKYYGMPPDEILRRDTVYITRFVQQEQNNKNPFYFALKTNLIYDAALLPNLTAEFYLGRQWSLAVEGNLSWWIFDEPKQNWWYHRIQAGGVELRKWFASPYPLQGHAIGLYTLYGNYDVRLFTADEHSKGWLSYQSYSAGLSYAYAMPIAKHFNLEFGLAFGYLGGRYYQYD
ncbi:MAG: DUF3575 domain-containing protein, partial [Paludibacter sp.]|nr:DUF3575 domain-containing protein [Paludibacter sp.]